MTGKRVLVCDDDTTILDFVAQALEDEGYEVTTAGDGAAALAGVPHARPELILLDMRMPVMDGWAFAREYHARHDHKAKIICMTAATDAEASCREIGADAALSKPFTLDELFAALVGRTD